MPDILMPVLIRLIADWLVLPITLIGAYALLRYVPNGKRYETYARLFMMGLSAYALSKVAGMVYQPGLERPFLQLDVQPGAAYLNNPGFPSDHALFVLVITLAVWVGTKHAGLTVALLTLSILVGLGRVLALVHTPVDILGAAVIVAISGIWWYGRSIGSSAKFAK